MNTHVTSERLSGVDAQRIEAELRDLWRREAAQSGAPMARLRTLNLVVFAERADDESVRATLEELPERHPARVVVIESGAGAHEGITAVARIRTGPADSPETRNSGEEIVLTAGSDAAHLLSGAALPLLMPDLPTFLWWAAPGDPFSDARFEDLSHFVDRTIIDTAQGPGGVRLLRSLADHAADRTAHAFADLNWNRIYAWREITAQFFDTPDLRDAVDDILSVEIAYAAADEVWGLSQATLYVCWLAGRLGWEPTAGRSRPGEREIWFDRSGGDLSARIMSAEMQTRGLVAVQLTSGTGDDEKHLLIRCGEGGSYLESSAELPLSIERRRITRFSPPSTSEVLLDELDVRHRDEVLEEALGVIRRLPVRFDG